MNNQILEETLIFIPARGGSKRLKGKNIKNLEGIPLIAYSIRFAKQFASLDQICISSDDKNIIAVAEKEGMQVPFIRPDHLASDTASSEDAILHALEFYRKKGRVFKYVLLLQPTSPLRHENHLIKTLAEMQKGVDAVISVEEKKKNHYLVLKREDNSGNLVELVDDNQRSFETSEKIYEINGSIYLLRVESLFKYGTVSKMKNIKKVIMSSYYSVDIDTIEDWNYCEYIIQNNLLQEP